jgi:hypothetical protein
LGVLAGGLIVALGATALHVLAPEHSAYPHVFVIVLALAVAYVIARACSAGGGAWVIARGVAIAVMVTALTFSVHAAAAVIFPGMPVAPQSLGVTLTVGVVFAGLFLFQSLLWRTGHHPWGRRFYVHTLNGFYLGTFFNRLLGRLWPAHAILEPSPCPLPAYTPPLRQPV